MVFLKRFAALLPLVGALVLCVPAALASDGTGNNGNRNDRVRICHATGSQSNPYVSIEPNKNGVVDGHAGHQGGRDIIPPFIYNEHGTDKAFAGQNWNSAGQTIWANDCNPPKPPSPPPPTSGGCPPGYSKDPGSSDKMLLCTRTVTNTVTNNVPVPGPTQTVTVYGNPQCPAGTTELSRAQGAVVCQGPDRVVERIVERTVKVYATPRCPKGFKAAKRGKGWVACTKVVVKNKTKTIIKIRVVQAPKPAPTR